MSTYVEWLDGQVTLKNAADAEQFADELMDNAFPDCFVWKWERPGVMNIQSNGDTSFKWQQALSSTLAEYASAWDIEAKEECCDPVRLFKFKIGQNEGAVDGTQLIYYPGFEDEFIRQLPDQVDRCIKQQATMMRWIPAEEKPPEDNITVLVTLSSIDNGTFVTVAWRDNNAWEFYADDDIPADAEVVAWMELPCPAQAQKG